MNRDGFTRALTLPLFFGLAGAAVGVLDAAKLAHGSDLAIALGGVWVLDAFTGVALGILAGLVLFVGDALHRLLGGRPSRALVDGLISAVAAIRLGQALFAGRGVRDTFLGEAGPYVFPFVTLVTVWGGSACLRYVFRTTGPGWTRRGVLLSGFFIALAAVAFWADRTLYRGLYEYLHVLLAFAALGLLGLAARVLWLRVPPIYLAFPFVATVVLVSLPLLIRFPVSASSDARRLLLEESFIASRTAATLWHVVDLDEDGFSPLLGGGDCDDLDARVNPGRVEIPRNGKDDDCDGSDSNVLARDRIRSHRIDQDTADRIASVASRYPTILILLDTLRADRVGKPRFPNLARLASESIRFDRAYSPATRTTWAMPAIATGWVLPRRSDPTIAERLQGAGKTTALVSLDFVLKVLAGKFRQGDPVFAMERGFDTLEIVPGKLIHPGLGKRSIEWSADEITRRTFSLLDRPQPPDFLWVHYFDLHQWHSGSLGSNEQGVDRYDAVLEALDEEIGHILERADQVNLILTSDHGEGLGEHNRLYHGWYLHRELVHVPLMIRVPGIPPASVSAPVSLTDLVPTILHLAGLSGNDTPPPRSLLGLVGLPDPGPRPPIAMFESLEWSVVDGKWRLIFSPRSGALRLYDTEVDPLETRNIAMEEPDTRDQLVLLLREMRASALEDRPRSRSVK
jgi:hypothetical protein